jgi:hypothetical protein
VVSPVGVDNQPFAAGIVMRTGGREGRAAAGAVTRTPAVAVAVAAEPVRRHLPRSGAWWGRVSYGTYGLLLREVDRSLRVGVPGVIRHLLR